MRLPRPKKPLWRPYEIIARRYDEEALPDNPRLG